MEYDIQFICCSCKITEIERKHIIRKHRKKHIYDSMEPVAITSTQKHIIRKHRKKYMYGSVEPVAKKVSRRH